MVRAMSVFTGWVCKYVRARRSVLNKVSTVTVSTVLETSPALTGEIGELYQSR